MAVFSYHLQMLLYSIIYFLSSNIDLDTIYVNDHSPYHKNNEPKYTISFLDVFHKNKHWC